MEGNTLRKRIGNDTGTLFKISLAPLTLRLEYQAFSHWCEAA